MRTDEAEEKGRVTLEQGTARRIPWLLLVTTLSIMCAQANPALGQPAPTDAADAIVGVWADERGEMEIGIFKCGAAYCAKIVSLPEPLENGQPRTDVKNPDKARREKPLMGLQIMSDLSFEAEGVWKGTMYAPLKGKQVNVTFSLIDSMKLKMKASLFIFSKTSTWTQVGK